MDKRVLNIFVVAFLVLGSAGVVYAQWWTPYYSINLRCGYEIMNATNMTMCDNGSITFRNGGWLFTTNNGDINLLPDGTGTVVVHKDMNTTCNEIYNVSNISGCGDVIGILSNIEMNQHNISEIDNASADTFCLTADTCITTWPVGGAGGAGMWIDGGTYLYPNATFATNIRVFGYIQAHDWSNVTVNETNALFNWVGSYDWSNVTVNITNALFNWVGSYDWNNVSITTDQVTNFTTFNRSYNHPSGDNTTFQINTAANNTHRDLDYLKMDGGINSSSYINTTDRIGLSYGGEYYNFTIYMNASGCARIDLSNSTDTSYIAICMG